MKAVSLEAGYNPLLVEVKKVGPNTAKLVIGILDSDEPLATEYMISGKEIEIDWIEKVLTVLADAPTEEDLKVSISYQVILQYPDKETATLPTTYGYVSDAVHAGRDRLLADPPVRSFMVMTSETHRPVYGVSALRLSVPVVIPFDSIPIGEQDGT